MNAAVIKRRKRIEQRANCDVQRDNDTAFDNEREKPKHLAVRLRDPESRTKPNQFVYGPTIESR